MYSPRLDKHLRNVGSMGGTCLAYPICLYSSALHGPWLHSLIYSSAIQGRDCQGSLVDKLLRDRLCGMMHFTSRQVEPPKGQLSTDDIAVDYVAIRCDPLQFRFDIPSLGLIPTAESPCRAGLVGRSGLGACATRTFLAAFERC